MIQDIYPHQFNNQFIAGTTPKSNDYVINTVNKSILVDSDSYRRHIINFPQISDFDLNLDAGSDPSVSFTYLFSIDEKRFFLLLNDLSEDGKLDMPTGYSYVSCRELRSGSNNPDYMVFAAMTGKHLGDWYSDNCYCGKCGRRMFHSFNERAMKCKCGYTSYPRIMPAVIVGVLNKDKILISKYKTGIGYNALIAGFTEIGETLEETVSREVYEETGIKVKNIRYYKSQPWGVANDILMGFYCDLDGDDKITLDTNELKCAEWVSRDELELQPNNYSLTNEMMTRFKNSES